MFKLIVNPGKGVTSPNLVNPWTTTDASGNLVVNFYNKVGTGHRLNSDEKGQIRKDLK